MKQGRALSEVLTEPQRQNAAKRDFIGPAQAFTLACQSFSCRLRLRQSIERYCFSLLPPQLLQFCDCINQIHSRGT